MKHLDAADVPPAFRPVTEYLEKSSVATCTGPWTARRKDIFSLPLRVFVASSGPFPTQSCWHLVVDTGVRPALIDLYPDAVHGPQLTYPHQNAVGSPVPGIPWLLGDPCLGRATDIWGERLGSLQEPIGLADRLLWALGRFERWCMAAGREELHLPGDHFELPALPTGSCLHRFGFIETCASLTAWQATAITCGVASMVEVGSSGRALAVQAWKTTDGDLLWAPEWGYKIANDMPEPIPCLWLRLDAIPIVDAWQLPRTYAELHAALGKEGHDLGEIFVTLGRSIRRTEMKRPAMLLIGFPIPEAFGAAPARFHWLAIRDIPLKSKHTVLHGFQSNEENRQKRDRELARSKRRLEWVRGENWAADQVRSRLIEPAARADLRMLLIGAGALGSQVAETLARSGIMQIDVQDADTLSAGNLCRHSLDLSDIGRPKAMALTDRLNRLQPDMRASARISYFPEQNAGDRPYDEYDVILDISGENSVLISMEQHPWTGEKLFISLSMTWAAQALLVWSSSGAAVPAAYVIDCFSNMIGSHGLRERHEEIMEGIGCWHPVFPANPAEVQLWAAIGARFVLDSLAGNKDRCGIYRSTAAGGIEYLDA